MPIELVQLLLPRLNLVDCLRLSSICKAWNSVSNLIHNAKAWPWLMYSANDSCSWRLFDPVYGKLYKIDMNWLGIHKNLTFQYSKDGWVLATKENKYLFLINPLTREFIGLPELNHCESTVMSFSSSPTNSDCMVFVVVFKVLQGPEISTWRPGEDKWSTMSFFSGFCGPCNPVFTRGELHCFRINGELSIYNPEKKTLRTLEIQAPFDIKTPYHLAYMNSRIIQCHLMELRGDLITVFRECANDPLRIYKLDWLKMVWTLVNDLKGVTVFLNHKTSLAMSCPEKKCGNMIYLSGFADEHCTSNASYLLDSCKYYPEDFYHLKEPINGIWIVPNLTT